MWRCCWIFALLCGWLLFIESEQQSSNEIGEALPKPAAIMFGNPVRSQFGRHVVRQSKKRNKQDEGKRIRKAHHKYNSTRTTTRKYFKHKLSTVNL